MVSNKKTPLCLIIRDGWGRREEKSKDNAIFNAHTPYTDRFEKKFPTTLITTSGLDVGLPAGYQGNSEVGHLNIGAGRIVYQSLTRIDNSISDGSFFENRELVGAFQEAEKRNSTLHLMGLIQEEGVHAVTRHCIGLLEIAKKRKFKKVLIHAITDGRDTPPRSALSHLELLQEGIKKTGIGRVVTVTGRYYAMDRDNRWNRTEMAYRAIIEGKGEKVSSWREAVLSDYKRDIGDEFITPKLIDYNGAGENDVFIFFNFRFDRTRQLTKAIVEKDFNQFETSSHNLYFVAMTHYYDNGNFREAFPEIRYTNILGEVISKRGLKQLRIAETEKYAHVTFFFNALKNTPFNGEERILVNSPKVATYDLKPEMSAFEVRDRLLDEIEKGKFDLIICNFANCDMVGHTGIYKQIVKAVETVDQCCGEVAEKILSLNGTVILTADHGNAEQTKFSDGSPMTSHTKNRVPFTLISHKLKNVKLRNSGSLCDISPTILKILEIEQPEEMSGISLIR